MNCTFGEFVKRHPLSIANTAVGANVNALMI